MHFRENSSRGLNNSRLPSFGVKRDNQTSLRRQGIITRLGTASLLIGKFSRVACEKFR